VRLLRQTVTVKMNLELACHPQIWTSLAKPSGSGDARARRREEVTTEGVSTCWPIGMRLRERCGSCAKRHLCQSYLDLIWHQIEGRPLNSGPIAVEFNPASMRLARRAPAAL